MNSLKAPSLRCEPTVVGRDSRQFYREEVGTCIPLGSLEAYKNQDTILLDTVVDFLAKYPPFLTELYYEVPVPPVRAQIEPLPVYDSKWKDNVKRLIGDDVGFVSEWTLLPRDLPTELPKSYHGQVIHRGPSPEIPPLIQWTDSLVNDFVPSGRYTGFASVWSFGTRGVVLEKGALHLLEEWAKRTTIAGPEVERFFRAVKLLFWVTRDLSGMRILSHRLTPEAICSIINS